MENIALQELEKLKRKILQDHLDADTLAQFESIEKAINFLSGQQVLQPAVAPVADAPTLNGNSIQSLVVNYTLDLIRKQGRQVKNEEILAYLDEKQVNLGSSKDRRTALASILFSEVSKKDGKLKRVARGVYYIK